MKEDIVLRGIGKADNDLKPVEKYLKAYLTWVDVRVGKTHDLASILYMTGR